jgi:hypothetical protein
LWHSASSNYATARLDHIGNENIRKDLKTYPATNKIDELNKPSRHNDRWKNAERDSAILYQEDRNVGRIELECEDGKSLAAYTMNCRRGI